MRGLCGAYMIYGSCEVGYTAAGKMSQKQLMFMISRNHVLHFCDLLLFVRKKRQPVSKDVRILSRNPNGRPPERAMWYTLFLSLSLSLYTFRHPITLYSLSLMNTYSTQIKYKANNFILHKINRYMI